MSSIFLTAEWRWLIVANYLCAAEVLLPHVPHGIELDSFDEQYFVSLVGFRFLKTRVKGIPFPFHRNFTEVNLRFYVRRKERDQWKRGVVFLKEIVPLPTIAGVANFFYHEKYVPLPMRHRIADGREQHFTYEWKINRQWNRLSAVVQGDPQFPTPGSPQEFFMEHYWGYTRVSNNRTLEYQVQHPSWRVWSVSTFDIQDRVEATAFGPFANILSRGPFSTFVAEGSPVTVSHGCFIDKSSV